jgi:hypothetical protein
MRERERENAWWWCATAGKDREFFPHVKFPYRNSVWK